ncbi:hypothetical protein KO465_04210 [Candidatus Micrarchaeota archaeon]|nr:hypothetical protein [Candidatus Micrarchaeota archaeon]
MAKKKEKSQEKNVIYSFFQPLLTPLFLGLAFTLFVAFFFAAQSIHKNFFEDSLHLEGCEKYTPTCHYTTDGTPNELFYLGLTSEVYYGSIFKETNVPSTILTDISFWITFIAFILSVLTGWFAVSRFKKSVWQPFVLGAIAGLIAAFLASSVIALFYNWETYFQYIYINNQPMTILPFIVFMYIYSTIFCGFFGFFWAGFGGLAARFYKSV